MNRYNNKIALVTGSNQGIGAACAVKLAQQGADLIIHGLERNESAEDILEKIKALGRRAVFLEADLSQARNAVKLVNDAIAAYGALDILVNNAGMEKRQDFTDITEDDYDQIMNVNLKSVFFATQAFVKHCRSAEKPGVIVNMSSVHEEIVFPHFAAYCVSKGGLKMLTRNLATELAPYQIRINNIAPGAIATPINQSLLNNKEQLEQVLQNIPLRKLGQPEDVANLLAFLASNEASYVTGSTYFIDGGLTYNYEEQ
jgi:glucose 1-dehydrogenase